MFGSVRSVAASVIDALKYTVQHGRATHCTSMGAARRGASQWQGRVGETAKLARPGLSHVRATTLADVYRDAAKLRQVS
jgi:hypothetical protein